MSASIGRCGAGRSVAIGRTGTVSCRLRRCTSARMARKPMPSEIASPLVLDTVPEVPFYIPATAQATRPRHTLKHGDTFIVLDSHGDMGATGEGHDGVFHPDTRLLSRLDLRIIC